MYDVMDFIDSKEIRDFNKERKFTPAEQAVLIARSERTTVEEKLKALQYLAERYSRDEFREGNVFNGGLYSEVTVWESLQVTIEIWSSVLKERSYNQGVIYAALLDEKDFQRDWLQEYNFFTSYEGAYQYLCKQKKHYLESKELCSVETVGNIYRIMTDETSPCSRDCDEFLFDTHMKLNAVYEASYRMLDMIPGMCLLDQFEVFLPIPFKPGDLVKVESPFRKTYYGVVSTEWTLPSKKILISMFTSVDVWDEEGELFDYIDDTIILNLHSCTEEELPENQKELLLLRKVRTGELDFLTLLYFYEKGDISMLM